MGGHRITITRITDYLLPIKMQVDGKIYPDAFEQGVEMGIPDVVNEFYLGAWAENNLIGFYRVQQMGMHLYQAHANIMQGYRTEFALDASEQALQWVAENITGFETLISFVPQCFSNVAAHVQAIGLQKRGTIPNAFKKNDKMIAIDIFSITKEEIKCRQPLSVQ